MAKHKKKINRVILINIFSTVLLNGINFFTAPLISRMLGAENYGVASLYVTWATVMSTCFGLQTDSTLNIAKTKFPEQVQERYRSSILTLSLCGFLFGAMMLFIFRKPVSALMEMNAVTILLMIIQAYGMFCVVMLNGKNTVEFQAGRNLILSASVSIATIALSILCISCFPKEINYWGRIIAMASVYGLFGIGITFYFLKSGKTFYSKKFWQFCLSLSIPIIFHSLANLILGQCDRVMLQKMLSMHWAGIYSLAAGFSSVIYAIWGALNNSWSPYFYELARNNQYDEIKHHGRNYLELYSVLTIGFMLLTPEVFSVFAAKEYWEGTAVIPFLVIGFYFIFLYSFPVNYEFYHCQTKATAFCTVLAALSNIVLNYLLIPQFGAFGAACATMIAHGLQFLFHHIAAKRVIGSFQYPFTFDVLLPYTVVTMFVAIYMIVSPGHWLVRWCAGAVLGIFELLRMVKRKSIF